MRLTTLPNSKSSLLLITACAIFVWGACANASQAVIQPAATPSTGAVIPTHIPTPSSTATAKPSPIPTLTPIPSPTATPFLSPTPLSCWSQGGHIETGQITTDLLRQPLDFRVYLPPCYHEQPERRYPVLYLIHGQSFTDDQWDRLGADETADFLIANGELPPFLIVMPRDRVWTLPGEDQFGEALVKALLPWVDGHYRTLPDRAYRAIGGLSRGAAWAVHLGVRHWELFSIIGAHSLPIFPGDNTRIGPWLDAIPVEARPRFYLDVGELDRWREIAEWFEQLLTDKDISHEWHLYPGYHEEAYWQAHLEEYIRWYAQTW